MTSPESHEPPEPPRLTDRLSEANFRELARLIRETHANHAARLERERQEAAGQPGTEDDQP
jgi:hypothetical protein